MSLTRTEIAQGCGVTPALISYYFKDKRSLLDAVTKPLLRAYNMRLSHLCGTQDSAVDKMFRVIGLLIELNTNDAFLVGSMLHHATRQDLDPEDRVAVERFLGAISELVRELVATGYWRNADPAMIEAALWGICWSFGEMARAGAGHAATEPEVFRRWIEFVYSSFAGPDQGRP